LAKALAELNRSVGPETSKAYQDAASTIGGLAGGFTGAARTAAEAEAEATAAELRRIGAPEEQIAKVSAVGRGAEDATYATGGALPAGALAREGAAAAAAANLLPATALGRGQMAVLDLDRQERELLDKAPGLRREFSNDLIEQKMKERAQALYEAQYGLDVVEAGEKQRHNTATERAAARRAAVAEKNYQLALKRHGTAVSKAEAEGREASASLSKGRGFLVDKEGKPILDNKGKKIPFKGDSKSGGLTPFQQTQQRQDAISEARDLRGDPKERSELDQIDGKGKYIGRDGRPTNDKKKAQYDTSYTFSEAQDYIVQAYGVTRTKARSFLLAAGWKPPRKPPKKSGR
jgi:hypothetical protein